jgi:pimeloyl-ACP methyl ester carboxylesterase
LKISKVIDNPWSVGMVRAEKAGLVLADAIINKVQGERGITLIGYSLGARVIYSCLMHLAEKRAFGCVENVVLMGAPCPSEIRVWAAMKSVVAGRLVNVYSTNDYILGFLYRSSSWQYGVAGLQKIQGVQGIQNHDVSDIVNGHLRYQYLVGSILKKIGWEDIDTIQVNKNEELLGQLMENEKSADETRDEEARRALEKVDLNKEAKEVESVVEKKNQEATSKPTQGQSQNGGGANPGK